ncbi:hypothetical protein GLE_2185 [Lysobacter enzymogenes]|uniref:Uncharacterized protein n=1 Tax=Lysobacter enzymogenes TaxID=69 RepID=A0A0S2DGK2_LYSEN|nr:hypothetical protein GLE_2185 [Lysobacter enzymogenes]
MHEPLQGGEARCHGCRSEGRWTDSSRAAARPRGDAGASSARSSVALPRGARAATQAAASALRCCGAAGLGVGARGCANARTRERANARNPRAGGGRCSAQAPRKIGRPGTGNCARRPSRPLHRSAIGAPRPEPAAATACDTNITRVIF